MARITIRLRDDLLQVLDERFGPKRSRAAMCEMALESFLVKREMTEKIEAVQQKGIKRTSAQKEKAKRVKDEYLKSYAARYSISRDKIPFAAKQNKLVYTLIDLVGAENAIRAAGAYPNYPGVYHLQRRHPFESLVSSINEVLVWLEHPERQLDAAALRQQYHDKAKEEVEKNQDEKWRRELREKWSDDEPNNGEANEKRRISESCRKIN